MILRVERLIFDAPSRPPAPHQPIDGAFIDAQIGDPTKVLDRVCGRIPLPTLQEVDPQIGIGCIERHITDKAKPMGETRVLVLTIVVGHSPGLLSRRHLLE